MTPTNLDALYRVPLFIRVPGQTTAEVHLQNAYGIDVLPTIVDLLDIELGPEWEFEGMSLFDPALPASRPHTYDHFTGHRESLGGSADGLDEEVAWTHQLIADQTSWWGVAAVGPHADLVGDPTASLDPASDPAAVAEFDQAAQFADLDPAAGIVPTVLTGRATLPDDVAAERCAGVGERHGVGGRVHGEGRGGDVHVQRRRPRGGVPAGRQRGRPARPGAGRRLDRRRRRHRGAAGAARLRWRRVGRGGPLVTARW